MSKLRISLSEQRGHIKGTVELPGDPAFVLDALGIVIDRVAQQFSVTPGDVVRDLYSLCQGKVT